jgi:hypothetical protein
MGIKTQFPFGLCEYFNGKRKEGVGDPECSNEALALAFSLTKLRTPRAAPLEATKTVACFNDCGFEP